MNRKNRNKSESEYTQVKPKKNKRNNNHMTLPKVASLWERLEQKERCVLNCMGGVAGTPPRTPTNCVNDVKEPNNSAHEIPRCRGTQRVGTRLPSV